MTTAKTDEFACDPTTLTQQVSSRARGNSHKLATKTILTRVTLGALFVSLLSSLAIMGAYGWPGLHWDASIQVTPAINRAAGRGDTFASYGVRILWQNLDYRFNWHGQLYQAVLGALLPSPDFVDLMRVMGWLNAFSVLICAIYYYSSIRQRLTWGVEESALWALLGAVATAAVLLYLQGRCEQLIPLLLASYGLVRLRVPDESAWLPIAKGTICGVVATDSPLPGVILLNCLLLTEACAAGSKQWLLRSALLCLVAVIVWFMVIILICPYSPLSIFLNTLPEAGRSMAREMRIIPRVWFWTENFPFIGGIFLLFPLCFIPQLVSIRRMTLLQCFVGLVLSISLGKWLSEAGIRSPMLLYNLICFFPLVFVHVVCSSYCYLAWFPKARVLALASVAMLTVATASGFLYKLALLPSYVKHGLTLTAAREIAQQYVSQLDSHSLIAYPCGRNPAFIVLSDANWHLISVTNDGEELQMEEFTKLEQKLQTRFKYYFLSQNEALEPAPRRGPFALVANYFTKGRPRFLLWDLAPIIPGYQFSVYERMPETSPQK